MTILEQLALRLTTEGEAQVAASLAGVDKNVQKLVKSVVALAAAFAGRVLWQSIIAGSVQTAIELARLSEQTGATVEDMSRLRFAATMVDVSAEELRGGLQFLTKAMQGVDLETGNAMRSLKLIGVETRDAAGKQRPLLDVLLDVSDRFKIYADGPAKGALALNILGRAGQSLIPLLNQGSDAIRELFAESDQLGNTMSTQAATKLREYNDAMDRVQGMLQGVSREIALYLIPRLTQLSNSITSSTETMNTWAGLGRFALSVFAGIGFVLNMIGTIVVADIQLITDFFTTVTSLAKVNWWAVIRGKTDPAFELAKAGWDGMKETAKTALAVITTDIDKFADRLDEIANPWQRLFARKPADARPDAPTLTPPKETDEFKAAEGQYARFRAFQRAQYEYQLQLAEGDYEAKRAIQERWLSFMFLTYGANSAEYMDSLRDIERADQEHKATLLARDVEYWTEIGQQMREASNQFLDDVRYVAEEMSSTLGGVIEATFSAAFSGEGIGGTFKAFGNAVLSGLGGIFKRMGAAWLTYGLTQLKFMAALFTPGGGAWAAIGLGTALIALGASLGAIGGSGASGGSGGGGGGFSGSSFNSSAPQGAVRFVFGENSTTTAAGMQPRTATNVTIIGPNDPRAQREMQTLLNNANRRGS